MALMNYREANQVLWRGCRPGHNGTQVFGRGLRTGAGLTTIYTVPATDVLYITYVALGSRENVAAVGQAGLYVYTDAAALWSQIIVHLYDLAGHQNTAQSFYFPLEIPTDYTVKVISDNDAIDANGILWGFTLPA